MEPHRPNLRLRTATPEFTRAQSDDWDMIRHLQNDILKASQRIKMLSLHERKFDELLETPSTRPAPNTSSTVKRGVETEKVKILRPKTQGRSKHTLEPFLEPKDHAETNVSRALREVLGRLKYLPSMYAEFKQKNLSVREMVAASSQGLSVTLFLQVLDFLDQLMDREEKAQEPVVRLNKASQTIVDRSTNTTADNVSRQAVSPRLSSATSPNRSPYASCLASPLRSKQGHDSFTVFVEDYISPIPSNSNGSFVSKDDDCLKLIDESEAMLETVKAQTDRIAKLNKQICETMATSKRLLERPGAISPFLSTAAPSEATDKRRNARRGHSKRSSQMSELSSIQPWDEIRTSSQESSS